MQDGSCLVCLLSSFGKEGIAYICLPFCGIAKIYLFGVLRRFQHCTGHITTGSWKGRGNQYIEFTRVVYCKLPTNGKQLPASPLKASTGIEPPTSEVGGESVTTLPPWPPGIAKKQDHCLVLWSVRSLCPIGLLLDFLHQQPRNKKKCCNGNTCYHILLKS